MKWLFQYSRSFRSCARIRYFFALFLFILFMLLCPARIRSQVKDYTENFTSAVKKESGDFQYKSLKDSSDEYRALTNAQGDDPNTDIGENEGRYTSRVLSTVTGQGNIRLELLLYDKNAVDPDMPVEDQQIAWLSDCNVLGPDETDPPPPYGDYPYGLWRCRVHLLKQGFDYEIHKIIMRVHFPGRIDPLNAVYCAQEFDVEEKKIVWVESNKDSGRYFPDIREQAINIILSDTRPLPDQEIEQGLWDTDPNKWVIGHVGGLLWPVSGGGRCFILHARPEKAVSD